MTKILFVALRKHRDDKLAIFELLARAARPIAMTFYALVFDECCQHNHCCACKQLKLLFREQAEFLLAQNFAI